MKIPSVTIRDLQVFPDICKIPINIFCVYKLNIYFFDKQKLKPYLVLNINLRVYSSLTLIFQVEMPKITALEL